MAILEPPAPQVDGVTSLDATGSLEAVEMVQVSYLLMQTSTDY